MAEGVSSETRAERPGQLRSIRLFASAAGEPRTRRAADAVWLAISLAVLAWAARRASDTTAAAEEAFVDFLGSWPTWMIQVFELFFVMAFVYALALLIGIPAFARNRLDVARDMLIAVLAALVAVELLGRAVSDEWPSLFPVLTDRDGPPVFPAARLAGVTAIVSAAAPQLSQPMRRVGRWVVGLTVMSSLVLPVGLPLDVLGGAMIGVATASLVKLIFGSPAGRPTLGRLSEGLSELDVEVHGLTWSDRQVGGAATAVARGADGQPVVVKVYGRDARDTQLLTRLWRFLAYRDGGASFSFSRAHQVEHEALTTLLARDAGATVPGVVAAGTTTAGDALLVTTDLGPTLAEEGVRPLGPEDIGWLWSDLDRCHADRVVHDAIQPMNIAMGPTAGLIEWGSATLGPQADRRSADHAALLATTALSVGDEEAIASARAALGDARLGETLPYLQPAALEPELRRALHATGRRRIDELADAAASAIAVDRPEPVKLRRITWSSVAMVLLGSLAAWAVVSMLGQIDVDDLVDTVSGASWGWVLAALVLAQVARFGNAAALLGSSLKRIRLVPAVHLQFATTFINLAIPSSAARMASNVRFAQKSGLTSTEAVTVGAVNSVTGFVIQIALILLVVVAGAGSDQLGLSDDLDGGALRLVAVIAILALLAVAIVLAVPKLRATIAPYVAQARAAGAVLRSPRKLALLLGGTTFTEVTFSLAILCCVNAYGGSISLASAIFVNEVVAIFAGLMPVPGGIGVTEAALTATLVAVGVPEDQAFAAAVTYRICSFYVPPLWGSLSLRWLRRHDYM